MAWRWDPRDGGNEVAREPGISTLGGLWKNLKQKSEISRRGGLSTVLSAGRIIQIRLKVLWLLSCWDENSAAESWGRPQATVGWGGEPRLEVETITLANAAGRANWRKRNRVVRLVNSLFLHDHKRCVLLSCSQKLKSICFRDFRINSWVMRWFTFKKLFWWFVTLDWIHHWSAGKMPGEIRGLLHWSFCRMVDLGPQRCQLSVGILEVSLSHNVLVHLIWWLSACEKPVVHQPGPQGQLRGQ